MRPSANHRRPAVAATFDAIKTRPRMDIAPRLLEWIKNLQRNSAAIGLKRAADL
jgi:hypothetical protein